MKQLTAYLRHRAINRVIDALEKAGFTEMTLIDVRSIGKAIQAEESKYSLELAEKYMDVIKLEMICEDELAEKAVEIIRNAAHTSKKGDGLVSVTSIEKLVQI